MKAWVSLCAVLIPLAGCAAPAPPPATAAPVAPEGTALGGDAIRAAFFGNTLAGQNYYGSRLTIYVATDGAARLRRVTPSGKVFLANGTVSLDRDQLCSTWTAEPQVCVRVLKTAAGYLNQIPAEAGNAMGVIKSTYAVSPGNPEGL